MEIEIKDTKLNDKWDFQRAKLTLEMLGISSNGVNGISQKQKEVLEKEVSLFLWKEVKKQFPKIETFCHGKRGGLND